MTEFPKTIALIKTRENSQWDIGDALIEECGDSSTQGGKDGSRELIAALVRDLDTLGLGEYTIEYLARLRTVASKFSKESRDSLVPWTFHREAGSSEMLQKIKERAKKEGKRITRNYISDTRKVVEKEERDEAVTKAKQDELQKDLDEKIDDYITSVNKMIRTGIDIAEMIKDNPQVEFIISANFRKAIESSEQVVSRLAKEISLD